MMSSGGHNKLTYEFVKKQFEREGYKVLSREYIGCDQKLNYVCPKGHKHNISWSHWNRGRRCPYCGNRLPISIEFIRSEFEKEGYDILTKKYINAYQKLDYICPNGHRHVVTWHGWNSGSRCYYCSKKATVDRMRLNYNSIKSSFEKENYQLLSNEYINAHQKLDYICPNGHRHSINWNHWNSGHRCPSCIIINNSGKNHYNWKGGISCEPYCDAWADKEYKESIKERDGYQCLNSDCWKTSNRLTIHHIDYNKKNCHPYNLITLCGSCNSRANYNREEWFKFYNNMIKKMNILLT